MKFRVGSKYHSLIIVDDNIESISDRGSLFVSQIGFHAIHFLHGFLPKYFQSGLRIDFFTPIRNKKTGVYERKGFYIRILPSLKGAVRQWNETYRSVYSMLCWRNYNSDQ